MRKLKCVRPVRRADPQKRPITVSLAANNEWPELSKSNSVDFVQVHPYAAGNAHGDLDVLILKVVREQLSRYGKPVLLGECGLDWRPPRETLDASPRAETGIHHAVWASVVSGAMCGRMLWWQDGYDQFEKADLLSHYQDIATTAAGFTKDVDFTGFVPISCEPTAKLVGGVLGNDVRMVGWFRDAECRAPDWPVRSVQNTVVTVPVARTEWVIDFFDPASGKTTASTRVKAVNGRIDVSLPTFRGSVAIKFSAD